MKKLIILFMSILFYTGCSVDRCTMGYYEDWQTYYIVDSVLVENVYVKDTFWIEAVHTYSKRKVKTKLKPIKIN